MAKQTSKEPGRFAQIVDVFKRTIALDKAALWLIIAGLVAPIAVSVVVGFVFPSGVFGWILWILLGITTGFFHLHSNKHRMLRKHPTLLPIGCGLLSSLFINRKHKRATPSAMARKWRRKLE